MSRRPDNLTCDRKAVNLTRISRRFAELRANGELGIVAYITAGDPSLDATQRFVLALGEAGADVIELGVPFTDPLADGPSIQAATERALRNGVTLDQIFSLVQSLRARSQIPIVLMTYYNPAFRYGLQMRTDRVDVNTFDEFSRRL